MTLLIFLSVSWKIYRVFYHLQNVLLLADETIFSGHWVLAMPFFFPPSTPLTVVMHCAVKWIQKFICTLSSGMVQKGGDA